MRTALVLGGASTASARVFDETYVGKAAALLGCIVYLAPVHCPVLQEGVLVKLHEALTRVEKLQQENRLLHMHMDLRQKDGFDTTDGAVRTAASLELEVRLDVQMSLPQGRA